MRIYIDLFLYLTLAYYLIAALLYFIFSKNKNLLRLATLLAAVGLLSNSVCLVLRGVMTGRLPVTNGSEFLLMFSWFTVLIYLGYELKSGQKGAGGIVLLIAALLLGSIPLLMPGQLKDLSPLMPALKSPWLVSHVLTAIVAYGGFALAAGIAAFQLKRQADSADQNHWMNRIVAGSFAMLTVTIILGAIWAEQAWGKYWSWDPKETWALVTWIIYAIYLHLYRQKLYKGRSMQIMVLAGFILVLFTYFGVNFLLSGLHSYS